MELFRKRNILFVIIIGVIIFTVFINQIGPAKLISLMRNVNKPLILLVLTFNLLNLFAFTKTWQLLARTEINFFKLFKLYMIGAFISNITPSFGSGGEPVKAMLLGKETGMSKSECFAGVVSQRMLNMFPFLVLSILGLGLLFFNPALRLGTWELLALLFSLLLGIGMFFLLIYFYVRKDKLSSFVHFSIRSLSGNIYGISFHRKCQSSYQRINNSIYDLNDERLAAAVSSRWSWNNGWQYGTPFCLRGSTYGGRNPCNAPLQACILLVQPYLEGIICRYP